MTEYVYSTSQADGKFLTPEAANNAYVANTRARGASLRATRLWARCGDSITAGAGATNVGNTAYSAMLPKIAGMNRITPYASAIDGSHSGDRSDQLLARMPAVLAQNPGLCVILIGTNDMKQGVSLATFAGYVQQIVALCQQAGVPFVLGTVPPCASSGSGMGPNGGSAQMALIRQYNLWLRSYAQQIGAPLAEVFGALIDKSATAATGYLNTAYDSGDGIHPNDAGHLAIAKAFAPLVTALAEGTAQPAYPWLVQAMPNVQDIAGLLAQPLMPGAVGSPVQSGWLDWGGIGGRIATNYTFAVAAPVNGDLPVGNWASMRLNGVADGTGGVRAFVASLKAGSFAAGDKLLVAAYVKCSDANAAGFAFKLWNGSSGAALTSYDTFGTATPGPLVFTYTVGAGITSIVAGILGTVTNAQDITFYIGAAQVWNLTQLGLDNFGY